MDNQVGELGLLGQENSTETEVPWSVTIHVVTALFQAMTILPEQLEEGNWAKRSRNFPPINLQQVG